MALNVTVWRNLTQYNTIWRENPSLSISGGLEPIVAHNGDQVALPYLPCLSHYCLFFHNRCIPCGFFLHLCYFFQCTGEPLSEEVVKLNINHRTLWCAHLLPMSTELEQYLTSLSGEHQ